MRTWCLTVGWLFPALAACQSDLPVVPTMSNPQLEREGQRVEHPPPDVRVEQVTLTSDETCLWRDGYWKWEDPAWEWEPGSWTKEPTPGCAFAPPFMAWVDSSKLLYWNGGWYTEEQAPCAPPAPCPGVDAAPVSR